jgi:hypothetical protein
MFTRGFMLDTSAINRVHDGLGCEWSLRGPLYVTDIQLQEIAQTRAPLAQSLPRLTFRREGSDRLGLDLHS